MKDPVNIMTAYVMLLIVVIMTVVIICKEKGFSKPNDDRSIRGLDKGLIQEFFGR